MTFSTPAGSPAEWRLSQANGRNILVVRGDWIAQSGHVPAFSADAFRGGSAGEAVAIDAAELGRWDSGLVAFLWDVKRYAAKTGLAVDWGALPDAARKLLALLPSALDRPEAAPRHVFRPLNWLGGKTIGMFAEIGILSEMVTETVGGGLRAALGKALTRAVDLLADVRAAGPSALMIVSVVNFLIGAILAFVGAEQLQKFAADIFVANLVGLALVREMVPVMTAIVMAGRTGGAYAARIATMQGNEELDALDVVGIPVTDYLILPSVLALVVTMPLLYLYGCLIGIVGGLLVSTGMLNITTVGFVHQLLDAVPFSQFVFGFIKSIAFAIMIGVTSCRIGLQAGRSAADVGVAATRAVVVGIVGVIAMDAVFAVAANVVGI